MRKRKKQKTGREPLSGQKLRGRAFDLLSRRDHSEFELRRKLLDKGAEKEELPNLFAEFRSLGYLNDERFAFHFVRYRAGKAWGMNRFRQELLKRGVGHDVVETVLSKAPELREECLGPKLHRLVRREFERGKEERKIVASLLRKGFASGQIRSALSEVSGNDFGRFD